MGPLHVKTHFFRPAKLIIAGEIKRSASWHMNLLERRRSGKAEDGIKSGQILLDGRTPIGINDDDGLAGAVKPGGDQLIDSVSLANGCGTIAEQALGQIELSQFATEMSYRVRSGGVRK